ncbi:hypothetical protein ALP60_200000 [Pseudomonas savastanoi]|uniref:Uncharacterized protein n=1 Tax=Pseudomonas savastanoi TaxID=29438 RepID=A0A3M5FDV3_PSESS|nr:hypothetical protein ALP60_200000 [Pseudomonas savastanoi]
MLPSRCRPPLRPRSRLSPCTLTSTVPAVFQERAKRLCIPTTWLSTASVQSALASWTSCTPAKSTPSCRRQYSGHYND